MDGTMYGATKYGSLGRLAGAGTAFGALNEYLQVGTLQRDLNIGLGVAKEFATRTFRPIGVGTRFVRLSAIEVDNKYGRTTHGMLKAWIDWQVDIGNVTGVSSSDLDRAGPQAIYDALTGHMFFPGGEVPVIQLAWHEWNDAGRPARTPTDVDPVPGPAPVPDDVAPPPPALDEGMGTGTFLLLLLLGAAGAYGLYYLATR